MVYAESTTTRQRLKNMILVSFSVLGKSLEWQAEDEAARGAVGPTTHDVRLAGAYARVRALVQAWEIVTGEAWVPVCLSVRCPDYGDPTFGEATCPAEHASVIGAGGDRGV